MAALVATKRNVVIRAFYKRLRDAGKAPKFALVAWMREGPEDFHRSDQNETR
jgi:transposase